MKNTYAVLDAPVITEKATALKDQANQIVFRVDRRANKVEIRKAVEKLFNVTVQTVNTMTIKGKPKRVGRHVGRRSDYKKAVVTLSPGHKIDFFEGV